MVMLISRFSQIARSSLTRHAFGGDKVGRLVRLKTVKCRAFSLVPETRHGFATAYELYKNQEGFDPALIGEELPLSGSEVFANADTPLAYVSSYGFDYDYTMAVYTDQLLMMIYETAARKMVDLGYPEELLNMKFDGGFATRGIHIDSKTGYLLKLDQFHVIQPQTVYYGRELVEAEDVKEAYQGMRVSPAYAAPNLHLLADQFSLPEANLFADVIQLLKDKGVVVTPRHVFDDVRGSIERLHVSGELHRKIAERPGDYIKENPHLMQYLEYLREGQKEVFLLTNSPFFFVDAGMRHLLRNHMAPDQLQNWPALFDIVICSAGKPNWYNTKRTFRKVLLDQDPPAFRSLHSFEAVNRFERGSVYTEGSLAEFNRLTKNGLTKNEGYVLYMGDHIFSDLSKPNKMANWKTAAVLPEIVDEIKNAASPEFRALLSRMMDIDRLIMQGQQFSDDDAREKVERLKEQRKDLRIELKGAMNSHFGSVFRTTSHRTHFFFEVLRYADLYAGSIEAFLGYPLDWCFYASRQQFVHEGNSGAFFNPRPPNAPCSSDADAS